MTIVRREFFARSVHDVAPELIGATLLCNGVGGTIVEVEAYCGSMDPGSHAYRGKTKRNAVMFGPPGGLYVYFTYGMHWCANAVCGDEDEGVAVLLRAAAPLTGIDLMRKARGPVAKRDRDLCSGPAKLCEAFGLDRAFDGSDLVSVDRGVTIVDDGETVVANLSPPRLETELDELETETAVVGEAGEAAPEASGDGEEEAAGDGDAASDDE
jgi:DNA-3-methyladenine glycosylase